MYRPLHMKTLIITVHSQIKRYLNVRKKVYTFAYEKSQNEPTYIYKLTSQVTLNDSLSGAWSRKHGGCLMALQSS